MKILFTLHYNFDPNAGAAGVTWRLGQEYQRLGHEVFYYSLDSLPRKLHRLAKFASFPGFVAHHISKLAIKQAVDVVDASTSDAWLWAAMQRDRKNHPLLITRCHGLEHVEHLEYLAEVQRGNLSLSWMYPLYRGSVRLWESATSMRYADLVLLLNRHDAKYAIENLGVNPDRTRIVTNGIPETFLHLPFEPTPAEDATIRIAQVSSYILRKGIHYGSPALNSILNRYPQVQVSFLGTECPAADVYADFSPAVRDRIRVVPYYTHETLPTLLKGHQIKLFPTISEGFGVALVEAMACGLAPVTTMTPGPMEIVRDGYDAIVVPCRHSWAIEQALERLITNRPYLDQLRRNAHATAQRYSWVRIARDNISLYEEALSQRK